MNVGACLTRTRDQQIFSSIDRLADQIFVSDHDVSNDQYTLIKDLSGPDYKGTYTCIYFESLREKQSRTNMI